MVPLISVRVRGEWVMAITLPDSRELSDEVLQALRLRALRGLELGFTQADIADVLGVARETVCRWWTSYNAGGLDVGIPHDRTGRPVGTGRTLSTEQETHLQHLINTRSPEDLGIASPLWNRRAIRDLIHNECGITMPVRTVANTCGVGVTPAKKPCRHNRKQDPEEVREWLETQYPLIEKQADKEQATIFW